MALPLGELAPKVTEMGGLGEGLLSLSVFAALGHLSLWERQGGLGGAGKQRSIPLGRSTADGPHIGGFDFWQVGK